MITPRGEIFMDGDEKLMCLPRMGFGTNITISAFRKNAHVLRVNIECRESHSTRASSAAAMYALHYPAFLELTLRHSADAVCAEIRVSRLNAAQAAQVFIADLLPFGN